MIFKVLLVSATFLVASGTSFQSRTTQNDTKEKESLVASDIKLINDVKDMYIKIDGSTKKYYKSSQTIKIPCKSGLEIYEAESSGKEIRLLFEVDDYKDYCGKEIKLSKILD